MSRSLRLAALFVVAMSAAPEAALGTASSSPLPGTATLPLSELLDLRGASERSLRAPAQAPPVRATINKLEIAGRLLDTGLTATAQVEVTVLGEGWVSVPLLDLRKSTHLASLATLEQGLLAVRDGRLCLVTDKAGSHTLTIQWLELAAGGRGRAAEVHVPAGSPAVLKLEYDRSLFRLTSDAARDEGTGAVLYPREGRFVVAWQQLAPDPARARGAARPPVEPVVTSAKASVVATLEGRRITRIQYGLRFEGQKAFAVSLPPGQTLERVFVNGAARPFKLEGTELSLPVEPARAGDQAATVELVTSEAQRGYPLSGVLAFTLPQPRWGVNDLFVTLHLPPVFEYRWAGGSLASVDHAPNADYAWSIPTPGKTLVLHQQLVSSFPTVQVAYTVNLTGSYYR